MIEDFELLRRYADQGAEDAFRELVHRHLGWVYGVALRKLGGDSHLASDVAQQVMTDLARKARALSTHPALSGWLFTSTHYAASQLVRTERRRRSREEKAHVMNEVDPTDANSAVDWDRMRPPLDDLIHGLKESDRAALLLRFFQDRTFAEVGARLNLSEDGARSRIERALEKLRAALASRGITSTTTALGTVLANEATIAAPTALFSSVMKMVIGAQPAHTGLLAGLTLTKMQTAVIVGIGIVTAGVWLDGRRDQRRLETELNALQSDQRLLATLRTENAALARIEVEAESLRGDAAQLPRLQAKLVSMRKPPGPALGRSHPAPPPSAATSGELVQLRLPDADYETALHAMQIYTGKKIVRDPSLAKTRGIINLVISVPTAKEEVMEMLRNAIRDQLAIVLEPTADGQLVARSLRP